MVEDLIAKAALYAVPLLLGVICHEVAHGWAAEKLGDPTARLMGRLTLNPLVHIDPVGTVILPIFLLLMKAPFLFGWAKPVPVQPANLRGGRRDMALVALAGPATNLALAAVSAVLYRLILRASLEGWFEDSQWVVLIVDPIFRMARISGVFNIVLMAVNLLPIPPLDGGRVLAGLVPESFARQLDRLEPIGMIIVLVLIGTKLWGYIVSPVLEVFLRFLIG